MTLHQLKCFVTLTQTLHYTEAANQLYMSQPSLSYAIITLEKELGVKLFEKKGKRISMTKYAKEFLPFAITAINSVDTGIVKLKEMMKPKYLRLGYIYSLSYDFLPNFLRLIPTINFDEHYTFSFYQGQSVDLIHKIQEDNLDLAFMPYLEADDISRLRIFSQEIFLVVPRSHRLSNKGEFQLSELGDEKFAMINTESNLRQVIDKLFQDNNFQPNIVFEGQDCNSLASFVATESGVSLFPQISSLVPYHLSYLRLADSPINRMIYLVWKTGSTVTPLAEKIQQAMSAFSDLDLVSPEKPGNN